MTSCLYYYTGINLRRGSSLFPVAGVLLGRDGSAPHFSLLTLPSKATQGHRESRWHWPSGRAGGSYRSRTGTQERPCAAGIDNTSATESSEEPDFIQLKNGPFDLDLIFAPDGIERFADAWQRRVMVEGFPVCHPDDIIASKVAANRAKDRESIDRLRSFRDYWLRTRRG